MRKVARVHSSNANTEDSPNAELNCDLPEECVLFETDVMPASVSMQAKADQAVFVCGCVEAVSSILDSQQAEFAKVETALCCKAIFSVLVELSNLTDNGRTLTRTMVRDFQKYLEKDSFMQRVVESARSD